jgi:hypothetical protein
MGRTYPKGEILRIHAILCDCTAGRSYPRGKIFGICAFSREIDKGLGSDRRCYRSPFRAILRDYSRSER